MCACVCPVAWACTSSVHVALLIQHATRMLHIVISFVAPLARPYFSTLSHKQHNFWRKVFEQKCVFWSSLQLLSETFLIPRRTQRGIVINMKTSSCKVPVVLVGFKWNLNFFRQVFEKSINIKFHQNPSSWSLVVPCERTDGHDEANCRFSKFCERA